MTKAQRQRLAADVRRCSGYMAAVVTDAERAKANIPEAVTASVPTWRTWAELLETVADNQGEDQPPLITRPHDWPKDWPKDPGGAWETRPPSCSGGSRLPRSLPRSPWASSPSTRVLCVRPVRGSSVSIT
jgi:hypothetical protein